MKCIFCKIIKNKIKHYKIFENKYLYSFLDISQTTKGHILLITKKHIKNIFELDKNLAAKIFSIIPKIANTLKFCLNLKGLNIINNNNSIAYQTIFHFHIHLIPRYSKNDKFNINFGINNYNEKYLENIKNKIIKNISNF